MGRKKKVTVKIIANTALSYRLNDEGEKEYPLYAQVTYDRKTTKFPIAGSVWGTEYEAAEIFASGYFYDNVLRIGEFERDRNEKFSVRGFANVYKIYNADFYLTTEFYLMDLVDSEVQKVITVARYKELNPSGAFNYKRGLEILGTNVTSEIRMALEAKEILLKLRVDYLAIHEWIIPGEEREKYIRIIESSSESAFKFVENLDTTAFRLIDADTYTI